MNRIKKLSKDLRIPLDPRNRKLLTSFGKKCFEAGKKYQMNSDFTFIDRMKTKLIDFADFISKK